MSSSFRSVCRLCRLPRIHDRVRKQAVDRRPVKGAAPTVGRYEMSQLAFILARRPILDAGRARKPRPDASSTPIGIMRLMVAVVGSMIAATPVTRAASSSRDREIRTTSLTCGGTVFTARTHNVHRYATKQEIWARPSGTRAMRRVDLPQPTFTIDNEVPARFCDEGNEWFRYVGTDGGLLDKGFVLERGLGDAGPRARAVARRIGLPPKGEHVDFLPVRWQLPSSAAGP